MRDVDVVGEAEYLLRIELCHAAVLDARSHANVTWTSRYVTNASGVSQNHVDDELERAQLGQNVDPVKSAVAQKSVSKSVS